MRLGTPRADGRDGRAMVPLIGAVLAACLTACAPTGAGVSEPTPAASTPAPVPPPTPVVDVPVAKAEAAPAVAATPPTRLTIDALGVDMPVTDVGVDPTGQMELPVDPAVAGWYRYGPDAAATAGHIVVSAHVDAPGYPIGPLARLRDVGVGAPIVVSASDGSTRTFIVESLTYYEKTSLPIDQLFAREGEPALVVITCGGPFDSATGRYRDNVVAIAKPQS